MCGEALQRGRAHRTIHQIRQVVEESPSHDYRSMSGHVAVVSPVTHPERLLQDLSDARRLQFLFQPLVFTAEPLDLAAQPLIFPAQIVRSLRGILPLWVIGAFRHAPRYARIARSVQEGTR